MDIGKLIMDNMAMISTFVFSIGAIAGILVKAKSVLTQAGELIAVVVGSMNDNTLTAEEVNLIIKEGGDVAASLKQAIANSKV